MRMKAEAQGRDKTKGHAHGRQGAPALSPVRFLAPLVLPAEVA